MLRQSSVWKAVIRKSSACVRASPANAMGHCELESEWAGARETQPTLYIPCGLVIGHRSPQMYTVTAGELLVIESIFYGRVTTEVFPPSVLLASGGVDPSVLSGTWVAQAKHSGPCRSCPVTSEPWWAQHSSCCSAMHSPLFSLVLLLKDPWTHPPWKERQGCDKPGHKRRIQAGMPLSGHLHTRSVCAGRLGPHPSTG